jgi:Tol biopolymer transport system component
VYAVGPRPDSSWDVTVGPATGGPERVVANYPFEVFPFWSPDGKWLYVERYGSGRVRNRHETYIERVPSAGGRAEVLFPVHPARKEWFEGVVGVSPDGRAALYMRNPDQFFYMTASGATGEITVPLPPLDDGWGHDATLESTRYLTLALVQDQTVQVLNLASGQVRSPLPPGVRSITPAWSTDGKRLAVRTGNVSDYAITVMNADGSGSRRYAVSPDLREHQDWGSAMRWSPNGRLLAFKADAMQKLAVLDLNSGQLRVLATSLGEGLGEFAWRSDGKAIITSRLRERAPPWGLSILEVGLDGTERTVRDLSTEDPWARGAIVISDRFAWVGDGSGRIVSVPIADKTHTVSGQIADAGVRVRYTGTSRDGTQVFGETDGPQTDLLIMSSSGDPTRTIHLPFESAHRGVAMLPDGHHVIVAGRKPGDPALKIFVVPLDGGALRQFAGIPGHQLTGMITLSADGTQVAFTTTAGRWVSTILEVDFGPSLAAIDKR